MRIRHRSIIILLSQGINQASTILLGILLVRIISDEMLGTYRQIFLVYGFIGGLLTLRLSNTLYYFLPKYGNQGRRIILGQTVLKTLTIATLISISMWFCSTPVSTLFKNPQLGHLIRVFSGYPLAAEILNLVPAFMISLDKPLRGGFYVASATLSRVCIAVFIFTINGDIVLVIWVTVLVEWIIASIGFFDMLRMSPLGSWKFNKDSILEQLSYAWPLWLTTSIGIISLQFGKLLISLTFTPDVYAIYSCGAIELPVVGLITGSLATAIMPNLVNAIDRGSTKEAVVLWKEGVRKSCFFVLPCFVFFLVFGQDFIILLYGKKYSMAAWPFLIFLFILPLRVAVYGPLLRALGNTRAISSAAFYAMAINLAVGASIVWIAKGGVFAFIGPPIGAVCGSFTMNVYQMKEIAKEVRLPIRILMPWKVMGLILALCILAAGFTFAIPLGQVPLASRFFIQGFTYTALLFALICLAPLLTIDERQLIATPLSILRKKILKNHRG